jgi:probable rRNA maturation factor
MSAPGDSRVDAPPAETPAEPEEPPLGLAIAIVREDGDWSAFGDVDAAVRRAARALARSPRLALPPACEAGVVLAGDALVRGLNRTYRGKDRATNVLSFPFQPPPGAVEAVDGVYLGDVVLAAETVAGEAAERGIEPAHHLQHLVIHGLLHLLGRDHQSDAEAEAMERLEAEILGAIGIADPYAAEAA